MNRRGFLKKCGLLPFIGSLAAVAKAGDSGSKLAGKTFFVDEKDGDDNNTGLSFDEAFATREQAWENCEGSPKDIIFVTSGSRCKITYTFVNPEHENIQGAREWLDEVEEIMNNKYNSIKA